jgi:hypothetical protein
MPPIAIIEMLAADTIGRTLGAHVAVMITSAPFVSPEAPMPDTVLPPMICALDCARAEIRLPNSNMTKKDRKVYCACQPESHMLEDAQVYFE